MTKRSSLLKEYFPNILQIEKQRDEFVTEVKRIEYTYERIKERLQNSMVKSSPLALWKSESAKYSNMYLLARAIFVLPYSSVPVERVFSAMKDIKNTKRNRLRLKI